MKINIGNGIENGKSNVIFMGMDNGFKNCEKLEFLKI